MPTQQPTISVSCQTALNQLKDWHLRLRVSAESLPRCRYFCHARPTRRFDSSSHVEFLLSAARVALLRKSCLLLLVLLLAGRNLLKVSGCGGGRGGRQPFKHNYNLFHKGQKATLLFLIINKIKTAPVQILRQQKNIFSRNFDVECLSLLRESSK